MKYFVCLPLDNQENRFVIRSKYIYLHILLSLEMIRYNIHSVLDNLIELHHQPWILSEVKIYTEDIFYYCWLCVDVY